MPDDLEKKSFLDEWNALPRRDRKRIRRLTRMGRAVENEQEAQLAVEYSGFQRGRWWNKFFWVWFAPGVIISLGIAAQIHPLFIGIVLALAAQAAFAHFNLGRTERINKPLLGQ